MTISIEMDTLLEKELEQAAKRLGVTKSQFIVDMLEKTLGHRNPYDLLLQIKAESANRYAAHFPKEGGMNAGGFEGDLGDSEAVRGFIRNKLQKKHGIGTH